MEVSSRGEVRRIHIIYFLSHMGRVEHPHLIRVHHLHRNGVHLRDVKRWLADLRGKDMPDSFSWSYKRRYKSGYVWQDLLDDDLITPISDNEYVLKGSEIFPTTSLDASGVHSERKSFTKENEKQSDEEDNQHKEQAEEYPHHTMDTPTKNSSEICQDYSPIFSSESSSSLSDDSIKQDDNISPSKQDSDEQRNESFENQPSNTFSSNNLFDSKKKSYNLNTGEKLDTASQSFSACAKSKSHSNRTSKMLRNLITCGAVDTNDAVLVALNKSSLNKSVQRRENGAAISKDEPLGGSARVPGTQRNQQQQYYSSNSARKGFEGSKPWKDETQQSKLSSVAYKPVGAPTCSHCRKSFKPEKLHSHMKSCRGMKSYATTASASLEKASNRSKHNQLVIVS